MSSDLTKFINLLATTDGRDKIYKTVQGLTKVAAQYSNKEEAKKYNSLSKSLGEGRSLMRMAKWVGNYNKLMDYAAKINSLTSRQILEILRCIGDFGYIFGDNLQYLAKYQVLPLNQKTCQENSKIFQFWGYICATFLDIWALISLHQKRATGGIDDVTFDKEAAALRLSLFKNLADTLATLAVVGYLKSIYHPSNAFTGMCGATSGAIATYQNWKKLK